MKKEKFRLELNEEDLRKILSELVSVKHSFHSEKSKLILDKGSQRNWIVFEGERSIPENNVRKIAVIAKDHSDFLDYTKGDLNGDCVFIDSVDKTRGLEFSVIQVTENARNISDLLEACKLRIRK